MFHFGDVVFQIPTHLSWERPNLRHMISVVEVLVVWLLCLLLAPGMGQLVWWPMAIIVVLFVFALTRRAGRGRMLAAVFAISHLGCIWVQQ